MALHTLEMVVKMQTGDAMSGLNHIESQIMNLADQVSSFKPMEFVNDAQINNFAAINEALRVSDKLGNRVYERNLESYLQAEKDLEMARNKAMAVADITGNTEKLASVSARYSTISNRLSKYYDGINEKIQDNSRLFNNIINSKQSILALSEKEAKFAKKIAKDFMDMKEAGVNLEEKFGVTKEHMENMQDFSDSVKKDLQTWESVITKTGAKFKETLPDIAQFGQLLSPLSLLGTELERVNKVYEDNHTVNNLFVADMYENATVTEAFADIQQNATKSGILLAESQRALNSVLNSGAVYFENNNKLLQEYVENVARASRATGISEGTIADLALRTGKLGEEFGKTTKLTDVFVNVMAENRLTSDQMSKIANVLQKDLSRLDNEFKIVAKDGKVVASGSEVIATMMGEIAEAARDAGTSADAAMDLMTRAIEDPLSVAPLLQGALTSANVGEQFLSMGKNAEMFLGQMEAMPPALQKTFTQKLGTTPEELRAMAEGSATMRSEVEKLIPVMGEEAARAKVAADITKERQDASAAAAKSQEAQANASRQLAAAMDQLRIIFAKVAVVMQPVLTFFAEILTIATSNELSKWIIVAAGAFLAFVGPMKLIKSLGGGVVSIFKGMGESAKGLAKAGGQGGGLKSLGDSIAGFIERLSKIDYKGAFRAATVIAAVGVALGIGVAAIAGAAYLLPPDKAAELAATLAGIVGAMYAVKMMGDVGKQALKGAGMLAVVGGTLAIGITFIGLAANALPEGKMLEFLSTIGVLLGVMAILAALGNLAGQAALGALALIVVGFSLSVGVGFMSMAVDSLPMGKATELIPIVGILLGTMLALGIIGNLAAQATLGALALMVVGLSLSGSVALLGLAVGLLPEGKAMSLLAVTGILLGTMLALGLMAPLAVPAMIGAIGLMVVGLSLSGSVALLGMAVDTLPVGKANDLLIITGVLLGTMLALGLMAPLAVPAAIGAVALIFVAYSLSKGVTMLGKSVRVMSPSKLKSLVIMSSVLVGVMAALTAIGAFAPLAMMGSLALVVVAGALAAAIGILVALGTIDAFAESIHTIGRAIGGLSPDMGNNLAAVAAGLAAFGAALIGNDVVAWIFGVDFIQSANDLGMAMMVLKDPIVAIAGVGPAAGNAFMSVGLGLKAISEALSGGGILDFFSGDMVSNATDLSKAMSLVAAPVRSIGAIGKETAMAFIRMAHGLKSFVEVLKEEAGWFDSFEDNATDIAAGIQKLIKPMQEVIGMQQEGVNASIREAAKVQAEEIKSALALTIEQADEEDNQIIGKLEEIRLLLEEAGVGGGGGTNKDMIEEIQKSNSTLASILEELSMGGSFGGQTYANTSYNT